MEVFLASLLFGAISGTSISQPPAEVSLTLSSQRASYYLGEPIRLEARAKNEGTADAQGFFLLSLYDERAEFYVRRPDSPPARFAPPAALPQRLDVPAPLTGRLPSRLKAGESCTSRVLIAVDPVSRSFVLDRPGEYEFVVVNHPVVADPSIEQRSNVLTIRVEEPPAAHRGAYEAYRSLALGDLVQSPDSYSRDVARIAAARGFLDEHAGGPYAEAVQRAYLGILSRRVAEGIATKEETTLFYNSHGIDIEAMEAQVRRAREPQ